MDIEALTDKTELKIMEREIQIHSQLDHPHIVKLWNTLLHDGKVYMIMEYAPNGNLFYHQNLKVRFSEAEAFKFFYQSAKAVEYLHLCDIIHRDIKVLLHLCSQKTYSSTKPITSSSVTSAGAHTTPRPGAQPSAELTNTWLLKCSSISHTTIVSTYGDSEFSSTNSCTEEPLSEDRTSRKYRWKWKRDSI